MRSGGHRDTSTPRRRRTSVIRTAGEPCGQDALTPCGYSSVGVSADCRRASRPPSGSFTELATTTIVVPSGLDVNPDSNACERPAILTSLSGQRLCHPQRHEEGDDHLGRSCAVAAGCPEPRVGRRDLGERGGESAPALGSLGAPTPGPLPIERGGAEPNPRQPRSEPRQPRRPRDPRPPGGARPDDVRGGQSGSPGRLVGRA